MHGAYQRACNALLSDIASKEKPPSSLRFRWNQTMTEVWETYARYGFDHHRSSSSFISLAPSRPWYFTTGGSPFLRFTWISSSSNKDFEYCAAGRETRIGMCCLWGGTGRSFRRALDLRPGAMRISSSNGPGGRWSALMSRGRIRGMVVLRDGTK